MKRKILKVVGVFVVALIFFTLYFVKTKNVSANIINDYQEPNHWFTGATEYNGINEINDLKGKTFNFNPTYLPTFFNDLTISINILEREYIGIEINEETHETIQCIDYLQYPYLIMENPIDMEYKIMSFYIDDTDNYMFLYTDNTGLNPNANIFLNGIVDLKINNFSYFPIDSTIKNDIPLSYTKTVTSSVVDEIEETFVINYNNYGFYNEENFLNNLLNSWIRTKSLYTNYYFCFPNTYNYTLSSNITDTTIFNDANFIQPYNSNVSDATYERVISYEDGYNDGYNLGYLDGSIGDGAFSIFTNVISSVNDILQIEIFPNVKLGYFIWLPLTLGLVGLILTFWRKD